MNDKERDAAVVFRFFNEIGIIAQLSGNALERLLPDAMTLPQFSVLNHFVRLGGEPTPLQLARAFQVTKGAMTNTLGHLQRKGFVSVRPDDKDGRSKRVSITVAGRAAHQRAMAIVAPEFKVVAEVFSSERLAEGLPLLEEMRAWLDKRRDEQ